MYGVFVALILAIVVIWTPGRFAVLPKWVHRVEFCPNLDNISEWIEASEKLNCGHDLLSKDPKKQNDVYHCLPSSFLNETVEFCGRNSPVEPGRCAVYNYEVHHNRAPNSKNCSNFSSGCPEKQYFSKNASFYPECFRINERKKCYRADPSCRTGSQDLGNNTDETKVIFITKANESYETVIAILVSLLILSILGYIVVYVYCKKRRHHKRRKNDQQGQPEERNGLLANGRLSAINNGTGNDTNFTLDEQVQMAYQYEDYSRINALLDMNNEEFSSIKRVLKGRRMNENEKREFDNISSIEDLQQYLWDKFPLPHNMVFVQGLLLASKVNRLFEKFVEFGKSMKEEPVAFFEQHISMTDSTKVEYVLQHHSSFTNNEIQKLLKILKSFTGAKDDDILVSAVKEGCIHVTLMIRNHLIPTLRSLYSPKNLRETCQRMSKSLQHRIIKVLIEDVPVYTDYTSSMGESDDADGIGNKEKTEERHRKVIDDHVYDDKTLIFDTDETSKDNVKNEDPVEEYQIAVRKSFVYLRKHLTFESLRDKLLEKNLLSDRERDYYVCIIPLEYAMIGKVIKLMIKKGRCMEFVDIIDNLPDHRHVMNKINAARQLANKPGHQENTCTQHGFQVSDLLLKKHFGSLFLLLEPLDIVDEMFQAGHISYIEHDYVTDSTRRYERLEKLLAILNRNADLYPHFVNVLQALGYSSVLDSLEMRTSFKLETSESALWIQQNFTYLLEELPSFHFMLTILGERLDSIDNYDMYGCSGAKRKIAKLLKILLRKGEKACNSFLENIKTDLNREDMVYEMKERSKCLKIRGIPQLDTVLQSLNVSCLQEHQQLLENELDPLYICDLLLEERAIELFEHDKVTEESRCSRQILLLLEVVTENKNKCFHFFLYILQNSGYEHIIKMIVAPVEKTVQNYSRRKERRILHNIAKIPDDVENKSVEFQLSFESSPSEYVRHTEQFRAPASLIMENAISHGEMYVGDIKPGSVVRQLRPITEQATNKLLNAKENNRLLEMVLGMLEHTDIEKQVDVSKPLKIKVQVWYASSTKPKREEHQSITSQIKEHIKTCTKMLIFKLEPLKLASFLSSSAYFSQSEIEKVNAAPSHSGRVINLLSFIEQRDSEEVKDFVSALTDAGFTDLAELLNPIYFRHKAESIRKIISSNYKSFLEEMQLSIATEIVSECIGEISDVKKAILPKNGCRRKRMNTFLHFIFQEDYNVIVFEEMLRRGGLEKLFNLSNVKDTKPTRDVEVNVVKEQIPGTGPDKVLFESVITIFYPDMNLKSSLLLRRSTIYISNMESIDHISALSTNTIWVSNPTLFQEVNCEGKVTRTIKDIGSYLAFSGIHSFTMYGDLIYIGIGCLVTREKETRVKSLQFDGSKKTLYTTDMELGCLYSSHINGDILIGVTNLRNFLFVRYTEAVKVIRCDYTGKKIQEIEFKHQDHTERLYKDPRYITENRINGNILVSDWEKDALVVVDKSGRHLFDYRGDLPSKKFFGPKAVCTDIHGRILLIHLDYDTDRDASTCISLLDQDGNFISRLLENDFAVHKSTALCVDEANNLYFGCKNRIEVFKLSDSH